MLKPDEWWFFLNKMPVLLKNRHLKPRSHSFFINPGCQAELVETGCKPRSRWPVLPAISLKDQDLPAYARARL